MLKLRNDKNKQIDIFEASLPKELFELDDELKKIDNFLDDERFMEPFLERFRTATGRPTVPVETYLRMMYLKHRHDLGYETLVKELSDSIKWRTFCKLKLSDPVPDSTTLIKATKRYGESVIEEINQLLVQKAVEKKIIRGKKLRIDSTTVEANIHYPTDNVITQAKQVLNRLEVPHERLGIRLSEQVAILNKVIYQTKEVLRGNRRLPDRLVSIFDLEARPIVKGRPKKPVEFGRKLFLSETEERLITCYELLNGNPSDTEHLIPMVGTHTKRVSKKPWAVATDAGFGSKDNHDALVNMGIKRVALRMRGKCQALFKER